MRDPRIDVLLSHLNLVCKYYSGERGAECLRAYGSKKYNDAAKSVSCDGHLSKCELTEEDRIKPDDKDWGEESNE